MKATPKSPMFSVIVTSFNREDFIGECLQSVLDQTFRDFELIVVDDGSTDRTPQIVETYRYDPRVRFYQKENGGQASALNVGLQRSSAPLIAFLDSDCRWRPTRLERHDQVLKEAPSYGVAFSENVHIDARGALLGSPTMKRHSGWITEALLQDNCVPFNSVTIRRPIIEQVGPFNAALRRNPDYEFWLRVSLATPFLHFPEVLTEYRVMANQLSSNTAARFESTKAILQDFLTRHGDLEGVPPRRRVMAGFYYRKSTHHARRGELLQALGDLLSSITLSPWNRRNLIGTARIARYMMRTFRRKASGR